MKKVLVGGCFDIFHYGHLTFLKKAKQAGDFLVVVLESDETVKKVKGVNRPVHTQKQRAELLESLKIVDEVIKLQPMKGYADYFQVVKNIHPSIIALTKGDPQKENKEKMAHAIGAKIVEIEPVAGFSTSKIISHLIKEEQ